MNVNQWHYCASVFNERTFHFPVKKAKAVGIAPSHTYPTLNEVQINITTSFTPSVLVIHTSLTSQYCWWQVCWQERIKTVRTYCYFPIFFLTVYTHLLCQTRTNLWTIWGPDYFDYRNCPLAQTYLDQVLFTLRDKNWRTKITLHRTNRPRFLISDMTVWLAQANENSLKRKTLACCKLNWPVFFWFQTIFHHDDRNRYGYTWG